MYILYFKSYEWECQIIISSKPRISVAFVQDISVISNVFRRQNELRHFAQNWAFLRFINFKRRKYSFPPPSPPCNVVPLF